ncbi:MAG: hypothetical protein JWN15_2676 [Firmicutes bacterium]|nr:hypothetical protein [Bacillota bacterium]
MTHSVPPADIWTPDRAPFLQAMKQQLQIDPRTTAVVTIDMHRGHLDPEVATMPVRPENALPVLEGAKRTLTLCREHGIAVIHVVLTLRPLPGGGHEGRGVKMWQAVMALQETLTPGQPSRIDQHNLAGSVQTELMPGLLQEGDFIVTTKKRLSSWYGTELEILLRQLKTETVLLMGINTNTCVTNAAFEAFNRDLAPVVIRECTASMYGEDLHEFALANISRCLGWVLTVAELAEKLA